MKKLKITILAVLVSLSAIGQIKIETDCAEITLPKNVKKDFKAKLIPNDDGTITMVKGGDYEYDGVFISFTNHILNGNKNFLADIIKTNENRRSRLKLDTKFEEDRSENINGNIVLISKHKAGSYNYYSFNVVNEPYTYLVSGRVEYVIGENIKAKKLLYEILKGIKIKDIGPK